MGEWRNLVCGVMIVILPTSLLAQDSSRAMLHSDGAVWLNGNPAPNSSAIFKDALIQTQTGGSAKIDVDGSTATIEAETIVQFEGDELVLDHGGLQANTARQMRVRVSCLTMIPLTAEWTRYDVNDVDGRVTIAALTNDVKIHYRSGMARRAKKGEFVDTIVHQGELVTRDEHCGAAAKPSDVVTANGAFLNSWGARGAGIGALVLTCLLICRTDDPVSPSQP